jgi:hypothetical protein
MGSPGEWKRKSATGLWVVVTLATQSPTTKAEADPGSATPLLAPTLFAELCTQSKICPRIASTYADVHPDHCVLDGQYRECSPAGVRPEGVLVDALMRQPYIPPELADGLFGYLVAKGWCGAKDQPSECFRWTFATVNVLRPDEDTGDPKQPNQVDAVGIRSIQAGPSSRASAVGTTVALYGRMVEVSDLEGDYLLQRAKQRVLASGSAAPPPTITEDRASFSVTYDTPAELATVEARVQDQNDNLRRPKRDLASPSNKVLTVTISAIDKVGFQAAATVVAREVRQGWRTYWMEKLQAKNLDEVAQYLVMQSAKQLQRGEFAAADASAASIHYFVSELGPEAQRTVSDALTQAETALESDLKAKKQALEVAKAAAEEKKRAYDELTKKQSSPKERVRRELCYVTFALRSRQAAMANEDAVEQESGVTDLKLRHDLGEEIVALKQKVAAAEPQFTRAFGRAFVEATDCPDER